MFISSDLGLPGAGLRLDGAITMDDGKAHVAVFAPLGIALPLGVLWTSGMVVMTGGLVRDPTSDLAFVALLWASFGLLTWRNARRAVVTLAEDAITTLRAADSDLSATVTGKLAPR